MAARRHPLSIGGSSPAHPGRPSFLTLPPEIRNHVYDLILKNHEAIVVDCSIPPSREFCSKKYKMYPGPLSYIALCKSPCAQLFTTCKQLFREAATVYYRDNSFVAAHHVDHNDYNGEHIGCAVPTWVRSLGSQACFLQKLEIDLDCLHHLEELFYESRGFTDHGHLRNGYINVKPLLTCIWRNKLDLEVIFTQRQGDAYQKLLADHPTGISEADKAAQAASTCDPAMLSRVFRSFVEDQLHLQAYGPLLYSIGLNRGGSAGTIQWSSTCRPANRSWRCDCDCRSGMTVCPSWANDFTVHDDGKTFRLQECKKPQQITAFPAAVVEKILNFVACSHGSVEIDVCNQTEFVRGIFHVNKYMYKKHWSRYISLSHFILDIKVAEGCAVLSNFDKLRRLLRKTFAVPSPDMYGQTKSALIDDAAGLQLILKFTHISTTSLQDVKIDALPLLMETSSAPGASEVVVRIWDAAGKKVAESTITIHELRFNVAKELMTVAFMTPNRRDAPCPKIWINGLGNVVDVATDDTSPVRVDGNPVEEHWIEKDKRYDNNRHRQYNWAAAGNLETWHAVPEYGFFPYDKSATEALRYLLWILDKKGPGKEVKARPSWCAA